MLVLVLVLVLQLLPIELARTEAVRIGTATTEWRKGNDDVVEELIDLTMDRLINMMMND